jgi:predicted PolB exonuclease-like 3'-5' exonuclease
VLVFNIETVPDVAGLRLLHALPAGLPDIEVAEFVFQKSRATAGVSDAPDTLPYHLHRVVSIACVLHDEQRLQIISFSEPEYGEGVLIQHFFDLLERNTQMVCQHGAAFDLPVLHARGLMHGVAAPTYWKHAREARLDLAEQLALGRQGRLHELATLCGYPGRPRLCGRQVWEAWRSGAIGDVRDYCETEAVSSYLLFLRFQLMRGELNAVKYAMEVRTVREKLASLDIPHWRDFLDAWSAV